jgi:hypothetical protein
MRPLQLDLVRDPLPDERFDLIYTLMTFHHIADTDKILRDLFSLLDSPHDRLRVNAPAVLRPSRAHF